MAALPVLLLGSVDLSTAFKAAKEEGMDPAGPGYLTPEFAQSPFAEGNVLTSVSANNREMVFPLIFRGTTKDAMTATLQSINTACAQKLPVRFTDVGYTDFTEFDVVFARFDVDYNYRRTAKNWLGGWLRVWARPYGTTGTTRIIGTAVNASGIVHVPIPTFLGDVNPEVTLTVKTGTQPVSGGGRILGAAVVPSGYQCFYPAGSIVQQSAIASLSTAASGSPDGRAAILPKVWYQTKGLPYVGLLRLGTVYAGRNRILGVVNPYSQGVGMTTRLYDDANNAPLGPTAIAGRDSVLPHDGYELVDLGIANVPTARSQTDFRISMGRGPERYDTSQAFSSPDIGFFSPAGITTPSSGPGAIAGFIVLPEDNGYLLAVENALKPVYRGWFGGSGASPMPAASFIDDFGVGARVFNSNGVVATWADLYVNAIPGSAGFNISGALAPYSPSGGIEATVDAFVPNIAEETQAKRITSLFGFCTPSTAAFLLLRTDGVPTGAFTTSVTITGMPSPAMSIKVQTAGGATAGGSVVLQPTTALSAGASQPLFLETFFNGSRAWANLSRAATSHKIGVASTAALGGPTSFPVACCGFEDTAARPMFGNTFLYFLLPNPVSNTASINLAVYHLGIDHLKQPIYTGSDIYTISDHDRAPGLVRNAGSTAIGIDDAALRGDGLKLIPGAGQTLAVFAVPQDGGSMQDVLDVTVRARERFSYLR